MKRTKVITAKLPPALVSEFDKALEKRSHVGGRSNFTLACAEALVQQIKQGDKILWPPRFLTESDLVKLGVSDASL